MGEVNKDDYELKPRLLNSDGILGVFAKHARTTCWVMNGK